MSAQAPAWAARLLTLADAPPLRPRQPLCTAEGTRFGSIEAPLAGRLCAAGLPLQRAAAGWAVQGPLDEGLDRIAGWLHGQGLCGRWRDELLAVTAADDARRELGRVERAAVRPLGIASFAVHLVGLAPDGRVWVQQRALDKATDPGLWDTLMGGMRAAGESVRQTLERECAEEAGLEAAALHGLRAAGSVQSRRPVPEGYLVEHIDVFHAVLPEGVRPENRDGEVAAFDCLAPPELLRRLREGAFTAEAGLILLNTLSFESHL